MGGKCFLSKPFFQHAAPGFSGAKSSLYLKFNGDVKLHKGLTSAGRQSVRESYLECTEAGVLQTLFLQGVSLNNGTRTRFHELNKLVFSKVDVTPFKAAQVSLRLNKILRRSHFRITSKLWGFISLIF